MEYPRYTACHQPRRAADSVLYQVVRDHYETFRAQAAALRDGEGLPRFIEKEFRVLAWRWMRLAWLSPVRSTKGCAALKPGGDQPAEGASPARMLVESRLPPVPVRPWVGRAQLPHRLR